jgi:hypothetical protein
MAANKSPRQSDNRFRLMNRNIYYLVLFPAIALAGVAVGDTARPTPAPAEIVHVGKREIRLPAPEGYFRFTRYNERVDQSLKNTGPHHLLVAFSSQDDEAKGHVESTEERSVFALIVITASSFLLPAPRSSRKKAVRKRQEKVARAEGKNK